MYKIFVSDLMAPRWGVHCLTYRDAGRDSVGSYSPGIHASKCRY